MDVDTKTKDHFRTFSITRCISKFHKWLEAGAVESSVYIAELTLDSATVNGRMRLFESVLLLNYNKKRKQNGPSKDEPFCFGSPCWTRTTIDSI